MSQNERFVLALVVSIALFVAADFALTKWHAYKERRKKSVLRQKPHA